MNYKKILASILLVVTLAFDLVVYIYMTIGSVKGHMVREIIISQFWLIPIPPILVLTILMMRNKLRIPYALLASGLITVVFFILSWIVSGIFVVFHFSHNIKTVTGIDHYSSFVEDCSCFKEDDLKNIYYETGENAEYLFYRLDFEDGYEYAEVIYSLPKEEFENSFVVLEQSANKRNCLEVLNDIDKYSPLKRWKTLGELETTGIIFKNEPDRKCCAIVNPSTYKVCIVYYNSNIGLRW